MKWKRARGTMGGVKDVGAGGSAHSEWVVVDDVDNTIREPAVGPCKKLSQLHVTLVTPRNLVSHSLTSPKLCC